MASTAKFIPHLRKYELVSSKPVKVIKHMMRLLAFSRGVYGKQYTKDLDSYQHQGSLADGTFGLYNVNTNIKHCIFEADVMYNASSDHPKWRAKTKETRNDICFVDKMGYEIPGESLMEELDISAKFRDPKDLYGCLIKLIIGKDTQIDICPIEHDKQGTAIKCNNVVVAVKTKGRTLFEIHVDFVAAGIFQEWPRDIPWLQTEGKWPSQTVRQDICRNFNLSAVVGRSGARYSFSEVEIELFSKISTNQRYAYIIFKSMFYCHVRPISCTEHAVDENEDPFFTSYLAKTTFLLMCEEHPPEDEVWQDIDSGVQLLLRATLEYLEQGELPHFALKHNLLAEKRRSHNYTECNIIQLAVEQLSDMKENFEKYLPDVNYFEKYVETLSIIFKRLGCLLQLMQNLLICLYMLKLNPLKVLFKLKSEPNIMKLWTKLETTYGLNNLIALYELFQ